MGRTEVEKFTSTPEGMKEFQQERTILDATDMIHRLMKEERMSKADLAQCLGTSPSHITQMLNGQRNMTLRTISDVLWALNRSLRISDRPLSIHAESPTVLAVNAEWKHWSDGSIDILEPTPDDGVKAA